MRRQLHAETPPRRPRMPDPYAGIWKGGQRVKPWPLEAPRPIPEPTAVPLPVVVIGSALFLAAAAGSLIGWAAVTVHEHLAGRLK